MLKQIQKKYAKSESGVAAIEFAFIAPVAALLITALVDVGLYVNARADMTSSIKSGVDYFLTGGQDTSAAISVIDHAWTRRPQYSTIEAQRFCECSEIVSTCSNVCSDGTQPEAYKKIVVTAYYDGLLMEAAYQSDETIRIR